MGNVHAVNCVLTSEDANTNLPSLMKRTCQRMSFRRNGCSSSSSCGSDKSSSYSSNSTNNSPKARRFGKKRVVLNTMPRCSSFENLSTALPSSKKVDTDPTYLLWKKAFEQRRAKPAAKEQSHLARMRRRVHNMSSAISGHLTPRGFPAFLEKRRQQSKAKKAQLQLPQLTESPRTERKIPVMHSSEQQPQPNLLQIPQHLATKVTLSGTTVVSSIKASSAITRKPKYTLAPLNLLSKLPQSKQAIIIEQLYRDIKELESRYDDQMESFIM